MGGMSRQSAGSNLANDVKCKRGGRIYVSGSPAPGSPRARGVVVAAAAAAAAVVVVNAGMVLRRPRTELEDWLKTSSPATYSSDKP